jgi:4'-phosphopantetheinyl transferase
MTEAMERLRAKTMPPTPLFWLECDSSEVPTDDAWLSQEEIACFREHWVPKRRSDWRLGRWTAKCALATHIGLAVDPGVFRTISILPAESGAPVVSMGGRPTEFSLSISHCDGRALVVNTSRQISLGCDLEKAGSRTRAFVEQFFTPLEIEQVEQSHLAACTGIETLIWSAKESVLKALAVGLRVDTRSVSVNINDVEDGAETDWRRFSALLVDGRSFAGWWCRDANWVRTIAGSGATLTPCPLRSKHPH